MCEYEKVDNPVRNCKEELEVLNKLCSKSGQDIKLDKTNSYFLNCLKVCANFSHFWIGIPLTLKYLIGHSYRFKC